MDDNELLFYMHIVINSVDADLSACFWIILSKTNGNIFNHLFKQSYDWNKIIEETLKAYRGRTITPLIS